MDLLTLLNNPALICLILWSLFWKGWALWVAGNRKEKAWFVVLFLLNTVGILEIVYLFVLKKWKKQVVRKRQRGK